MVVFVYLLNLCKQFSSTETASKFFFWLVGWICFFFVIQEKAGRSGQQWSSVQTRSELTHYRQWKAFPILICHTAYWEAGDVSSGKRLHMWLQIDMILLLCGYIACVFRGRAGIQDWHEYPVQVASFSSRIRETAKCKCLGLEDFPYWILQFNRS